MQKEVSTGRVAALRSTPAPSAPESRDTQIAVHCLTQESDFARLAPEWNELHSGAAAASVFNSWFWQYQWWQVYGGSQPLRLLVAQDGEQTLGILPLYVQRVQVLGMPVRMLRFVGTGGDTHPDDLGPVLANAREEEVAALLARAALALPEADVVALNDIDPSSPFTRALERTAGAMRRAHLAGTSQRIAYLDLPASWDEFLRSLNSDRRSRMRSARRKAAAAHALRFHVWSDAAELDTAVDRLVELHRKRWSESGGSNSFSTPEYVGFHRSVIKSAFLRGWLRLYCLELDGELAAITYCYRFRNRVFLMQAGFDPALARCNPGRVLLGYALEHAIGEGNTVFDFLRGEHRYKEELATGHRETQSVHVFRSTPAALAYRLRRVWLPTWKARLLGRPLLRLTA